MVRYASLFVHAKTYNTGRIRERGLCVGVKQLEKSPFPEVSM